MAAHQFAPHTETLLAPDDPRVCPRVVAAFSHDGAALAGVRALRSTLSSRWHADAPEVQRSVALIGLDSAVEVAATAANLAVVSAQSGWRTLLIDGDLPAPALHDLFRLPGEEGLSTLLQQPDGANVPIRPTAIARLAVLPAGPALPDAAGLIERRPVLDVLDGRAGRQRLVLLSLSARVHGGRWEALGTILSGFDGALAIAGRHRSGLRTLQQLADLLETQGIPLLGTAIAP